MKSSILQSLSQRLAPEPMPESLALMLCTAIDEPFDGADWIFEPKLDGLRILCQYDGEELYLFSRNGNRQELQFPEIAEELKASLKYPALLDGEIVCLDEHGNSSFKELQQRLHLEDAATIGARKKKHPAFLYLFDVLYLDRFDVTGLPLMERKELLRGALDWTDRVRWTEWQEAKGKKLFSRICKENGEGLVAKRKSGQYVGARGGDWVKLKCIHRQEFVVIGFTDPKGSRFGLGALLLGYYTDDGKDLVYAGKVGTGFDTAILRDLRSRLDALVQGKASLPGANIDMGADVHWVSPKLVAEIEFGNWTQHGLLRHPRFEGLRFDKDAKDVRREKPEHRIPGAKESLDHYQEMRDFSKTREPSGKTREEKPRRRTKRPLFVIQMHHATRLHWDFRLESGGVLKSWAVTKEPSLDPSVRRLAVEVEDHPIEYAGFEGQIPEGQYGAGHVEIWDHGTFEEPEDFEKAYASGKIGFKLFGKRLRGQFTLVRLPLREVRSKPQWLLIKTREKPAEIPVTAPAALPAQLHEEPLSAPHVLRFTSQDKLMFPGKKITKSDVLSYYREAAPYLLPYLKDRPLTLERMPEGVTDEDSPHFWQKNTPSYYPQWIKRALIESETGKMVHYAIANDVDSLLYLVNQNAITFHIWSSTLGHLDRPDFVLFDLDPGEASFGQVIEVARELNSILKAHHIDSYLKTSGKTGLHVLAPWLAQGGYDEARGWALKIAAELEQNCSKIATLERAKQKRLGKIYLDVMQNARGHHFVPPYVIRAVSGAPVSYPLQWKELKPGLDPHRFDLQYVLKKIKRREPDPMKELLEKAEAQRRSHGRS